MIKYPLNVTIDTNIFISNKFDFSEDSTLSLLVKYVQQNKIKVILSDIVVREVEKHIVDKGDELCKLIRKSRKDALSVLPEELIRKIGVGHILLSAKKDDVREKSKAELRRFLDEIKVETIKTSIIDLDSILEDYFSFKPPFEDNDRKRKEFPDAFIANQIRARFGKDEIIAIVSMDKGLKKACKASKNHLFFSSLGELYNAINKEEKEYEDILNSIKRKQFLIANMVKKYVLDKNCVEVIGLSYDKDGIEYGYAYHDFVVQEMSKASIGIHTIDEITDEKVIATLLVKASIDVLCTYKDYDNAVWDSEEKSYIYVETRKIKEKHSSRFGCRIEIKRGERDVRIIPFKIILNSDTRIERIEVEEDVYNYMQEEIDDSRRIFGLQSLNKYNDYLASNLEDSEMEEEFKYLFGEINSVYKSYEDICLTYDMLIDIIKINREKARNKLLKLSKIINKKNSFPLGSDIDVITDDDIEGIIIWAENNYNRTSKLADKSYLPDSIGYGETVAFIDDKDNEYRLSLDSFMGIPSGGELETIDILFCKGQEVIARGCVELTVGYYEFDDEGGVAEAIDDNIEYNYESIAKKIRDIIFELQIHLENEKEISEIIDEMFVYTKDEKKKDCSCEDKILY